MTATHEIYGLHLGPNKMETIDHILERFAEAEEKRRKEQGQYTARNRKLYWRENGSL
jgi:hypothetical protein